MDPATALRVSLLDGFLPVGFVVGTVRNGRLERVRVLGARSGPDSRLATTTMGRSGMPRARSLRCSRSMMSAEMPSPRSARSVGGTKVAGSD